MPDARENILANVKTTLAGITTGGGYSQTVVTAERGIREPAAVPESERPYLGVFAGIGLTDKSAMRMHRVMLTVRLVGYLALAADKTIEERGAALNAFLVDVKKALLVDVSRGGSAVVTTPVAEGTDADAVGPSSGGSIELEIQIPYWHSFTNF